MFKQPFSMLLAVSLIFSSISLFPRKSPAPSTSHAGITLSVLDRNGHPTSAITDGNLIRLDAVLQERSLLPRPVIFRLVTGSQPGEGVVLGECTVLSGRQGCQSEPFHAWGWYWHASGLPRPVRDVTAELESGPRTSLVTGRVSVQVSPRPVVMVHGFSSSSAAWVNYLGPDGYLAGAGIPAYAVGDGQFSGTMNTGSIPDPAGTTNTIAENAAILGGYIEQVKKATGAETVDLLAHSMGGLISRYYIGREMGDRDVGQLIMLGSPMAGTDCGSLPASLGFYLPASLELRPSYIQGIFNQQVTDRHGVPFYAIAGIPIQSPAGAPCTEVPTDIAVSRQSVAAIPVHLKDVTVLHTELNTSREIFAESVLPILQTPVGGFPTEADLPSSGQPVGSLQFASIFTGHVNPGQPVSHTIQIDPGIAVGSFALFDPTLSLTVTVQGASGNVIPLNPATNGLVIVDNPETMVYLGYGFENPRPGPWVVTLAATDRTPPTGADYAITAHLEGGAALFAQADPILPAVGEDVSLTVEMQSGVQSLPVSAASAQIRGPDGFQQTVNLISDGSAYSAVWQPTAPGLYSIDLHAAALGADGAAIDRTAFLSIEAQPASQPVRIYAILLAIAAVLIVILLVAFFLLFGLLRRLRRRRT